MDLKLPFMGKKEKSIEELEEETENLEAENRKVDQELSLEKKKVIIEQLKQRGLQIKHFSGDSLNDKFKSAISWLKQH